MLVRTTDKFHSSISIQFGIPYTYLMASITRKFDKENSNEDSKDETETGTKKPMKLRGAIK